MERKTLFHIVREGWGVLVMLIAVFFIVNAAIGFWLAVPLLPVIALAALYFRDSPRQAPAEPMSIIAPADGRIVHRREGYDPYLDREAIKLTIRLRWFGAYLLRSPVEGTVLELPGEVVLKQGGVASWIRTDGGDDLVMAIRRGSLLGRQPCRNGYGERIGQSRCCGQRRLARDLDLFLPINARVEIDLGDQVRGGARVLARLVHKTRQPPDAPEARSPGARSAAL